MIKNREQRSPVDEEIRLQNSKELMYGNMDTEKDFPFDVSARFKWVIYHESVGYTEDGQAFSKKATRRYSFFTPQQWEETYNKQGQKSWFELQNKQVTILHDPIKQAEIEGKDIFDNIQSRTGMSLAEKLRRAKTADQLGKKEEKPAPKRPAARTGKEDKS